MKYATSLALGALVVSIPAVARADSNRPGGTFRFKGDVGGSFDGKLVIEPREDGTFAVTASEERDKTVTWSGTGTLQGHVLTIVRAKGIVEAIDRSPGTAGRSPANKETELTYSASFDASFENAAVTVKRGADTVGTASLEERKSIWAKIPGELLGLARKEVDKAVHEKIDLSREFDILSYGHIGIRASAQILEESAETPLMKESDDAFRKAGKGSPIWVRSIIEGGPRVAYSVSVPLDTAGEVRIDAGFSLGGEITYTCDDQHALPKGVKDVKGAVDLLEDVPARVFALPLTAARAEELPEGTRRTLAGDGSLAINGGVSFGYRLEELGALKDKATVGVNGGASVTWNIRGDLQLEFERQQGRLVRLRWTKGSTRQLDAGVQALLGFYVSDKLLAKVKSPEDKVVSAVVKQGEHYTTVEFNASAEWLKQNELAIDMLFDLSDDDARAAYERAVRGDLVAVQALADRHVASGLKDYKVTSTLTDALSFHAKFSAFKVLSASTDRKTTNIHVDVAALDGATSATDIFDYARDSKGLFGGKKSLSAEAVTREVVRPNQPVASGQRVEFKSTIRDDHTWKDDLLGTLRLGALLFGQEKISKEWSLISNDDPGPFHHYGRTDMTLEVTLGSSAIEKVLSASWDDLVATYGRAHWEHDYHWTAERVALLRRTSLVHNDRASAAEEALRLEAWDYYYAEKVLKLVQNARKAGTSTKDRVAAFRDIAKKDGFALRAVVAFALIAGDSDVQITYKLKASDWMNVDLSRGEAKALPAQP